MTECIPRLPLTGGIGDPIWCSICGSALTDTDRQGGIWSCQCLLCREVMQARVRRRMGAEAGGA